MSEAKPAAPEGGKKKGKMPMIIAVVVMVAAGGFFGSKMGGSKEKEEPKIELGETVSLGEFLVNLRDGHTFLKADISVQIGKDMHLEKGGGGGHEGKAEPPAPVRDAVIAVLTSQSLEDVSTPEGKTKLKKLLAKAINKAVPHEDEEKDKKKSKKKKKKHDEEEEADHGDEEEENPDWDDQHGPVLKVFFTNFATQE